MIDEIKIRNVIKIQLTFALVDNSRVTKQIYGKVQLPYLYDINIASQVFSADEFSLQPAHKRILGEVFYIEVSG